MKNEASTYGNDQRVKSEEQSDSSLFTPHTSFSFADVILPLPLANSYTYHLPHEMTDTVEVGSRVIVPFGKKRFYTAIVIHLHNTRPEGGYEIKSVTEVLDQHPVLSPGQLKLWRWIADYYLCTLGDVYKAALPSGMKLESETRIEINPDYSLTEENFLPYEEKIFLLLGDKKARTVDDIEKETGIRNALPTINALLHKEAISVKEEMKRTYRPKTETRIRLAGTDRSEAHLHQWLDLLKRAPKQQQLLMDFIGMNAPDVSKRTLLAHSDTSPVILTQMIEKGIFEPFTQEVGRLKEVASPSPFIPTSLSTLNPHQQEAFDKIKETFCTKSICLLHGVTSSGKTEIYIHLIMQALQEGKQVLYLLPEIALTTQITERLQRVFGPRLGVYHSKFPDAERVEIWQKQLSENYYDIILGVRSSVFLPFRHLGLIIVDEEHENTYKQQDPAPRYHARSAATVLAAMQGAKVLLGTATPSIESYYNALTGKYGLVSLTHRHRLIQLPEIQVVDIAELRHKRRMNGAFSPTLLEHMRRALEQHEQIILFQNRRGFAPMVECKTCGWTPRCKNCDVSLTYHKGLHQLTCHYCGYTYQIPEACPACESTDIRHRGFGTERIEDNIQQIFPEARIARMDLDTTRTRQAYERIINDFQQHRTDILIGTQMVSKGLDFEHVSVVGILDADSMMNFPDFRSHERAFQLMAQVAGRAGRKSKQGLVVLQTRSKDAPVINQVVHNDYAGLYDDQLAERMLFRYPPYYRLFYIYLKHRDATLLDSLAHTMAIHLKQTFGDRILGPTPPPVARIQTFFIRQFVLKMETSASPAKVREHLQLIRHRMLDDERFRSCTIYFDADPC
ncbi:MAG: primosomal protein N' [Bacteroidaceae bacterium]|nr:primosomal protein N' [Bacteroidaceae bacterium]